MFKQAVIVAAGKSSRLYPRTLDCPKGLLKVGSKTILQRSIDILKKNGVERILMVVGYKYKMLESNLKDVDQFIINPFFEKCNNMGSLWFAKPALANEPFVYLHGDILYDEDIFVESQKKSVETDSVLDLVVDFGDTDDEAMKVKLQEGSQYLLESSKDIPLDEAVGEWTGISFCKDPQKIFSQFESDLMEGMLGVYDTYSFTNLVQKGEVICCLPVGDKNWIEVDFEEDYSRALNVFG